MMVVKSSGGEERRRWGWWKQRAAAAVVVVVEKKEVKSGGGGGLPPLASLPLLGGSVNLRLISTAVGIRANIGSFLPQPDMHSSHLATHIGFVRLILA